MVMSSLFAHTWLFEIRVSTSVHIDVLLDHDVLLLVVLASANGNCKQ